MLSLAFPGRLLLEPQNKNARPNHEDPDPLKEGWTLVEKEKREYRLSVSRSDTLFVSGSFDDANIPKSRYPGLITIAHTREDGTDGERCENGTHKMEGRFVCWRSMLQMIDDVLDIDMMRSC